MGKTILPIALSLSDGVADSTATAACGAYLHFSSQTSSPYVLTKRKLLSNLSKNISEIMKAFKTVNGENTLVKEKLTKLGFRDNFSF